MSVSFNDFLGYMSIACWLGAQFPQVVENYRRKSVEGLALPFLLNWLLGDFTNLVGCVLTHQLPFQTYLAIYFVFVDCSLMGQYAYYRKSEPTTPYLRARSASYAGRGSTDDRHHTHYRTISTVAANVAASAARAAHHEAISPHTQRSRWLEHSTEELYDEPTRRASFEITDDEEVGEEALARLASSFHSEGDQSSSQKHVSWSKERSRRSGSLGAHRTTFRPSLHMTSSTETADYARRGRSLQREGEQRGSSGRNSDAVRTSTSRASKKGASMIFLSVFALFGLGSMVGSRRNMPVGQVLTSGYVLASTTHIHSIPVARSEDTIVNFPDPIGSYDFSGSTEPVPSPTHEEPSWERIVGRVFAWACTTLYLTSRLPQIWKNFVRKSVEGLSMYLFIFAFLGNVFYVSSLLTSPRLNLPGAAEYIRESIPYILGSGGTLMFDVTIVTQSFIYRPPSGRATRKGLDGDVPTEEEGLLSAGATGSGRAVSPRKRTGLEGDNFS